MFVLGFNFDSTGHNMCFRQGKNRVHNRPTLKMFVKNVILIEFGKIQIIYVKHFYQYEN